MSLMNPVISDLIVAGYQQDRWAEVERLAVQRERRRVGDRSLLVRQRAAMVTRAVVRLCSQALAPASGHARIPRPAPAAMSGAGDGGGGRPS